MFPGQEEVPADIVESSTDAKESESEAVHPVTENFDIATVDGGTTSENSNNGVIHFNEPLPPEFPLFAHYDCSPITIRILRYLTASELFCLSNTSRSMYMAALSPILWKPLLLVDFVLQEHQIAAINGTPNDVGMQLSSTAAATKKYYAMQVRAVNLRIENAKSVRANLERELVRDKYVKCLECCLDMSMVRIFAPLPMGCVICTLVLVGLRTDGLDLSIWWCLAPVIFLVLYLLFCGAITFVVYMYRHSTVGLLRSELWQQLRSPAQMLFEVSNESSSAAKCAVAVCMLLLIQLILLGVKVSTSDTIPSSLQNGLYWGVVFLPMWILFALYLAAPVLGVYSGGPGPFFTLLALCWIPLFILLTCLTVKLTGIEEGEREGRMRIALIITPFWVLEGVALLGSLAGLVNGLYRYRQGFLERESLMERIGIFSVFWGLLSPLVIFQAFMSARDDEVGEFTLLEALSPLLFLLSAFFVFSLVFAVMFVSPYQHARTQRELDAAGTRELFDV